MSVRAVIGILVFLGFTGPRVAAQCLLEPGKSVQESPCSFEGQVGDYIRVIVEPNFVKLSARLIAPGGNAAAEADNTLEEDQGLPLAAIAVQAGVWHVEVTGRPSPGPQRRFSLRLEERRPARSEDARRIAADRAFLAGLKKRMGRNAAAYRTAAAEFS